MNKKRLLIIILIFSIILIFAGIILNNWSKTKEPDIATTSTPPPTSSNSDESTKPERQIELETELEKVVIDYLKQIYGNTYPTKETLEDNPNGIAMGVTLREFKERYGQDISMFHTDEISCDEDYTTGIFRYDSSGPSYEASLICEYTGS